MATRLLRSVWDVLSAVVDEAISCIAGAVIVIGFGLLAVAIVCVGITVTVVSIPLGLLHAAGRLIKRLLR